MCFTGQRMGLHQGLFSLLSVTICVSLNVKLMLGDITIYWDTVFYSVYIQFQDAHILENVFQDSLKRQNRYSLSSLQDADLYLLQRKGNKKAVNNKF
jgi:hypothetical protein